MKVLSNRWAPLHVRDDEEPDHTPYRSPNEVMAMSTCHQCGEPGHSGSHCRMRYNDAG